MASIFALKAMDCSRGLMGANELLLIVDEDCLHFKEHLKKAS